MTGKQRGFGALKDIRPDTGDTRNIPDLQIDEVADKHGSSPANLFKK